MEALWEMSIPVASNDLRDDGGKKAQHARLSIRLIPLQKQNYVFLLFSPQFLIIYIPYQSEKYYIFLKVFVLIG